MSVAQRRIMAPLDSIWLAMDRPHNLMVIVAVVFLGDVPDWDEVSRLVQTRMVDRYPAFRQKVHPSGRLGGRPHWVDDEDFSLERHLRRVTLPPPGDDGALQRYMEEHVTTPLDLAHPLWEVHLVERHGSGAAIVCRVHHALADGLAMAQVLLSLTDEPEDQPQADPTGPQPDVDDPDEPDGGGGRLALGFDLARAAAAQVEPGLLHGVVGLAERAQHAVGHRPQVRPVGLELFRQPLVFVHR